MLWSHDKSNGVSSLSRKCFFRGAKVFYLNGNFAISDCDMICTYTFDSYHTLYIFTTLGQLISNIKGNYHLGHLSLDAICMVVGVGVLEVVMWGVEGWQTWEGLTQ